DKLVTGVQTCALPIFLGPLSWKRSIALLPPQRLALPSAVERFQDSGPKTDQPVFEDVITRAALEIGDGRFFIERAGDQNEGHIRSEERRGGKGGGSRR